MEEVERRSLASGSVWKNSLVSVYVLLGRGVNAGWRRGERTMQVGRRLLPVRSPEGTVKLELTI